MIRFIAGTALALIASPAAAQVVGVTSVVRNDVRLTTPAQPVLHRAAVKERVALGNDVVTGGASAAQLLLLDKSSFSIGANARVRIDRFVYDPARQSSSLTGSIARGAFRFMSGRALHANPGQSSLRTPVASIGIRGTIVEGAVGPDAIAIMRGEGQTLPALDPETASLILLRGPGPGVAGITPGAIDITVNGAIVAVEEAGLALFVPGPGLAPVGPFRLSDEGLAALHALLRGRGANGSQLVPDLNPTIDRQFECQGGGKVAGLGGGCGFQDQVRPDPVIPSKPNIG